jgi:hypothetical protein
MPEFLSGKGITDHDHFNMGDQQCLLHEVYNPNVI